MGLKERQWRLREICWHYGVDVGWRDGSAPLGSSSPVAERWLPLIRISAAFAGYRGLRAFVEPEHYYESGVS